MENMKITTLEELNEQVFGKKGTPKRDEFEKEIELVRIGETIKEARKSKSLSQEQLGALIGVQKSRISKIENGKGISFDTFLRLFRAMKIPVKLIFTAKITVLVFQRISAAAGAIRMVYLKKAPVRSTAWQAIFFSGKRIQIKKRI